MRTHPFLTVYTHALVDHQSNRAESTACERSESMVLSCFYPSFPVGLVFVFVFIVCGGNTRRYALLINEEFSEGGLRCPLQRQRAEKSNQLYRVPFDSRTKRAMVIVAQTAGSVIPPKTHDSLWCKT